MASLGPSNEDSGSISEMNYLPSPLYGNEPRSALVTDDDDKASEATTSRKISTNHVNRSHSNDNVSGLSSASTVPDARSRRNLQPSGSSASVRNPSSASSLFRRTSSGSDSVHRSMFSLLGRSALFPQQREANNASNSRRWSSKSNQRPSLLIARMSSSRSRVRTTGSIPSRRNVNTQDDSWDVTIASLARTTVQRSYNVGDFVLISVQHSRVATLVNEFGFPSGEGDTPEEQRGPYCYVLATIKTKHFEEIALYYTVTRCDTGTDQRADSDFMKPLRNKKGELAAKRAATAHAGHMSREGESSTNLQEKAPSHACFKILKCSCYALALPFLYLCDWLTYIFTRCLLPTWLRTMRFLRDRANLVLNGREPYVCRLRITMVNLMVLCSTWFMFIDQVRLALFPPEADHAMAVVNMVVWIILLLELVFEVFILPDGYLGLIISDKAYAPTTVRFINAVQLAVESFNLLIFIPEFLCLFQSQSTCGKRYTFSFHNAVVLGVMGPKRWHTFYGHAYMALIRLRVFGLVRHWRNMWITNTFINMKWKAKRSGFLSMLIPSLGSRTFHDRQSLINRQKLDDEAREEKLKELTLINASNIGTALMVTNSYRALIILWAVTGLFPIFVPFTKNPAAQEMTQQLQAINLMAADTNDSSTCAFLRETVTAWTKGMTAPNYRTNPGGSFLVTLEVHPYRCGFSDDTYANVYVCDLFYWENASPASAEFWDACLRWKDIRSENGTRAIAKALGIREGSLIIYKSDDLGDLTRSLSDGQTEAEYSVIARIDHSYMVRTASIASLLIQLYLLFSVLGGLSLLRRDAEILVLGPLRNMLKIVARYAKNPLVPPKDTAPARTASGRKASKVNSDDSTVSDRSENGGGEDDDAGLGSYETEQLIRAIARITDLLRKCWGVAGANIISTNLATREGALTEVFNPTVPGKSVYALFAFAAINGFDHALRNLKGEIMVLINDVAKVLHDEVFRWGFGESGQCNKNLGSAFLMVFRIGLVEEVIEKLEQAQDVIWSAQTPTATKRRNGKQQPIPQQSFRKQSGHGSRNSKKKTQDRRVAATAMSLSLQSLPGISTFTDRAVIGMLKSFAGIYRDQKVLDWSKDFRLSAGVGAFRVSLIFGMDAGWAVEGAVGSEYKIDATYLSPHVNMASRMMGACKQYGVTIMLSQAVQELMSEAARSKLRHLDTVTVKGSSVIQRIYTFDCKAKGVDFFLYGRSDDQADMDAEVYSPDLWLTDQDLRAMGQHVTEDFLKQFRDGHKAYLAGDWPKAIQLLERANDTMFETAVEEGYLEDEFNDLQIYAGQDFTKAADDLKRENGDGPSIFLINFMKSYGGVAPQGWEGWHPLTRK